MKSSICWNCKNACNSGCTWSRDFIPVNGWNAKERIIPNMPERYKQSFCVIECPEYKKDR